MLDDLISNFEWWTKEHRTDNGLYWSIDDRDAMEFSISGSGFRPTLNSYLYADAAAISRLAEKAGKKETASRFAKTAEKLKESVQNNLWNGDFFQVIPAEIDCKEKCFIACGTMDFEEIPADRNVKELIGYIPWYFNLPDAGYEKAFYYLTREENFLGKAGLRTADRSHPRFAFEVPHECLWNGPAWPYATTQALVALANLLQNYSQEPPAVKPLIPEDWEYFFLEGVKIHGKTYTILYDRDGSRYDRGEGLQVLLEESIQI